MEAVSSPISQPQSGVEAVFQPRRRNRGDRILFLLLSAAGLFVPVLMVLFLVVLLSGAWPLLHSHAWTFLTSANWDPNNDQYGALPFVFGTLLTATLALLIAAPIGIGVAAFLHEILPMKVRAVVGFLLEILA